MKHVLFILMVCSFAANAQTPFHERFYNHLNKPPKAIRAIVKEDPELATFRKYKDARDSLRFLSISITREFEVTYFVFDGNAIISPSLISGRLLNNFFQTSTSDTLESIAKISLIYTKNIPLKVRRSWRCIRIVG